MVIFYPNSHVKYQQINKMGHEKNGRHFDFILWNGDFFISFKFALNLFPGVQLTVSH